MNKKINPDKKYGEKIIQLFAKLLFSGGKYSLTQLSQEFECSKQSILRIVDDITFNYEVVINEEIQKNQKYFWLEKNANQLPALINLSTSEYNILRMCHAFTKHLVGTKIFEDAEKALDKNREFLANKNTGTASHFGTIIPGTIDYTPKKLIISNIITALEKQLVCRVVYKKLMAEKNSVFYIKPLKLFSHKEALYLHAKMAPYPNSKDFSEPEYDPVIAIHRIVGLFITETQFQFPQNYDFDKTFNQHFGIIKDDTFKVTVQFTGFASVYVSERIWSGDQKIEPNEDGIEITFTASSAPETITWILSFGRDAKVIEPAWLIKNIKEHVEVIRKHYENIDQILMNNKGSGLN